MIDKNPGIYTPSNKIWVPPLSMQANLWGDVEYTPIHGFHRSHIMQDVFHPEKDKSPTVLIVVGNHLDFDPGIPVVYYKSRIQKLRDHDYRQKKIS